jgi:hypothetical protein
MPDAFGGQKAPLGHPDPAKVSCFGGKRKQLLTNATVLSLTGVRSSRIHGAVLGYLPADAVSMREWGI